MAKKTIPTQGNAPIPKQPPAAAAEHPARQRENSPDQPPGQERTAFAMNAAIGWILQGGVIISSAVILIGLVLSLIHSDQITTSRVTMFPHSLVEVWSGLLALQPQAVIVLGLLLLLLTPVVRVAASIVAFALERDRRYVIITTVVLLILIVSFLLGKGGG